MSEDREGGELVVDRDALRRAAEASTPGPWRVADPLHDREGNIIAMLGLTTQIRTNARARTVESEAAFIAAASPDVVLALLALLDRAEQAATDMRPYVVIFHGGASKGDVGCPECALLDRTSGYAG